MHAVSKTVAHVPLSTLPCINSLPSLDVVLYSIMIVKERRNQRNNWQEDYNKWWNRKQGTPVKENPFTAGADHQRK